MKENFQSIAIECSVSRNPQLGYDEKGLAHAVFGVTKRGNCELFNYEVEVWGKLAEYCTAFLKIGRRLDITGMRRTGGTTKIIGNDIKFIPQKKR